MPEISLTDFVDFSIKSGPSQLTKVRELFNRDGYNPSFDFWKPLREGIQEHHQNGTALESVLVGLTDKKKIVRYPSSIKSYKQFLGKKEIEWFKPPRAIWKYSDLMIRVNPEVGLAFQGKKYAVKLYFKDERPTKAKLDVVFELMRTALNLDGGVVPAVLDVSNKSLKIPTKAPGQLVALLEAQAIAFNHMWKSLGKQKS